MKWEPGLAVVSYTTAVEPGEVCFRCGGQV